MGNVLDSFFTGFFNSIGNFFGSPLDFLSGKSCSSVCPSPWDVICFVENFCVANLAKAALILILSYFFLFFIYMLYKVGFWHCTVHGLCRLLWAFVSCWFYVLSYCCSFFCYDMFHTKRRRRHKHRRYTEDVYDDDSGGGGGDDDDDDSGDDDSGDDDDDDDDDDNYDNDDDDDIDDNARSFTNYRSRRECRKEERRRKSLRARSHRVRVGVRKDHRSDLGLSQQTGGGSSVHGIRVSRESKFARKGSKRRTRAHHGPRRA